MGFRNQMLPALPDVHGITNIWFQEYEFKQKIEKVIYPAKKRNEKGHFWSIILHPYLSF